MANQDRIARRNEIGADPVYPVCVFVVPVIGQFVAKKKQNDDAAG